MGRQVGHVQVADRSDARDLGVVVDGEAPVRGQAHVELDPVAPEPAGLGERVERVLDEPLCATPVSEDGRHGAPVTPATRIPCLRFGEFTKTPCERPKGPLPFTAVNPLFTDGHLWGPIM